MRPPAINFVALIWVFSLGFLGFVFIQAQQPGRVTDAKDAKKAAENSRPPVATAPGNIYSRDGNHIWNRIFRLFYVRAIPGGQAYGGDELDPYLWQQTNYLLTGPSHNAARKLLDEFLQQHAEKLITDPLRRALLQRDLWAVYDWLHPRGDHLDRARLQLRKPLGEIVQRLALTEEEIRALPDNYSAAIQAKIFPPAYDAVRHETAFLPDLFNPSGPWVCVGQQEDRPVASLHLEAFQGRAVFLVFLRLPGERSETLNYLEQLRKVPSQWVQMPRAPTGALVRSPQPQQFPVGTQMALVRQMVLITDQGKFVPTHLTESVQLRVYRAIDPTHPWLDPDQFRTAQDVFEFKLERRKLLAQEGGLHAVDPEEKEFPTFLTHGLDVFESRSPSYDFAANEPRILTRCVSCHYDPGVQSFISHSRAHFAYPSGGGAMEAPPELVETTPSLEAARDALWRPHHPELNVELLRREGAQSSPIQP